MYALLTSIIALSLTVAMLLSTISYLDTPFYELNRKSIIVKINQNYIDFGIILDSADSQNEDFNSINNIKDFNGVVPSLNNIEYDFIKNAKAERVFFNSNLSDGECLDYEKNRRNNKSLNIGNITETKTVLDYSETTTANISCYRNSIDGKNYIVFVYPIKMS